MCLYFNNNDIELTIKLSKSKKRIKAYKVYLLSHALSKKKESKLTYAYCNGSPTIQPDRIINSNRKSILPTSDENMGRFINQGVHVFLERPYQYPYEDGYVVIPVTADPKDLIMSTKHEAVFMKIKVTANVMKRYPRNVRIRGKLKNDQRTKK